MYKIEDSVPKACKYQQSQNSPNDSISIFDGFLEFWIHGPRNVSAVKGLPEKFSASDFQGLVQAVLNKTVDSKKKLVDYMDHFSTVCNSFSFPTFQLKIKNPMEGFLPFPVKDLRLMVDEQGGTLHPSNADVNAVHIKASTLEPPRKIAMSQLWSQTINTLPEHMLNKVKNQKVYQSIKNFL
jgi:hypothetical protein